MDQSKSYDSLPVTDLTGGLNDTAADTALPLNQSPRIENFDLDRGSLSTTQGSIKFGNQVAPRSAVRCRPDPALSPLAFGVDLSVPLRGYAGIPYLPDYDIGGRFDFEGSFDLGTETFHGRRGRSFQLDISFRIPEEERLYEAQTRGVNAPAIGSETAGSNPPHGFDEALDECTIIVQKGGDRTTPMSWALGIVNIGDGTGLTALPSTRPSNYALVFMWLDSPQWGESSPAVMRYTLTSGAVPSAGAYSTQAFRSILIHKYVEPGRDYSASVQLKIDTGTAGGAAVNTAWNHDGYFKVWVKEDHGAATSYTFVDSSGGGTSSGLEVYKGPTDSTRYLSKYGIRYAGRDMMFLGLGQRSFPWQKPGFIPYGSDCASLKFGGFQMLDRSGNSTDTIYGAGVYTLTALHVSGDAYVKLNHQYGAVGNTLGGTSPYAIGGPGAYTAWQGLGSGGTIYNTDALRHYRLIAPADFDGTGTRPIVFRGGVCDILSYSEGGGEFRLSITNGATAANFGNWDATKMLVQAFRWNQRQTDLCELRIWSTPRAYDDVDTNKAARRLFDIDHTIELEDTTNYELETLQYYLPCDDSEGTVLREKIVGGVRSGHMYPFGLGTTDGGLEGDKLVMLSGEGEAPCVDFSENPVVLRELKNMLAGTSQGFAIEISVVFPEAYYAIQDNTITLPGLSTTGVAVIGSRPRFVPELLSWDVRSPTTTGFASTPRPLITLTHRGALASTNAVPFKFPMGFSVEVANASDNEDQDPIVPQDLQPFFLDGGNVNNTRYGYDAPWVGKNVTIQIGVQSTGTADQYDVYIALSPKDAFLPATGDPGDAEFAYWTKGGQTYTTNVDYQGYFSAAHLTIKRKDLVRSVITLGRWNCGSLGYAELQPRMLIDKVRFFASSAPGNLPTNNGGILSKRDGKLESAGALPQRELELADILQPVAPGSFSVDVTDGSATVTPHGASRFFTSEARSTIAAVKETYLFVQGETHRILQDGTLPREQEELYRVGAVASDGSSLTLQTPYADATRVNAYGASLRLLAYTAFSDDIRDKPLSLGPGKAFKPGTTTVADVVMSDDFWLNKSPITGNWKLRIYSPFGRTSLFQVLPQWVRGCTAQRQNPIRGIQAHGDRIYAAVRGSLFECDDRWRTDGPSDSLTSSLAFRARVVDPGVTFPLAHDRVELAAPFAYTFTSDTFAYYIDAWVKLDSIRQYQTVLWVGDPGTNPSLNAGSSGHRLHLCVRLNRGRPELVLGSTAFYTGTTVPEKGLFIATGAAPIAVGEWTHVRWAIATRSTGAIMLKPYLKVNGRKVSVIVNAIDNDASVSGANDWLRTSTLVASGASGKTILGASHDAFRAPAATQGFASGAVGVNVQPNRLWSLMHALDGALSETVALYQPGWGGASTGTEPPDFDPFALTYAEANTTLTLRVLSNPEGVGHKVYDSAQDQYGIIISHPFVSVWHELGATDQATAFAEFGTLLLATSGAKPAVVRPTGAGLAGVPAPTTVPSFSVTRFPVWKPNVHSLSAESPTNDPVLGALPNAATQINHYDNHGNNYWRQVDVSVGGAGSAEMLWTKVSSTARMFAFKCYVKPRKVDGRGVLWSMRNNVDSGGPFVEIRDGRVVFGWFDTLVKKEVTIDSGAAVLVPGQWHYIEIRKEWPQGEAYGNWNNSYWANGRLRRLKLTANSAGAITTGDTITVGAATGRIIYSPSISGSGYGSYAANQLTAIEYIKSTVAEIAAGNATWTGSGATNTVPSAPTRPTHDSFIVRHFGTVLSNYTDHSRMDPMLAKVGVLCTITITAGTRFLAGDTLTGAGGGVAVVLWAHDKSAVTVNVQNVCVYFTSGTTFAGNITGGGVTTSALTTGPTAYRDCISAVIDDSTMTAGGASGRVTRAFALNYFAGAAGGIVNATALTGGATVFHPGMVGMYWMWGSVGNAPVTLRGRLYRITSISEDGLQAKTVVAGTTTIESFAGIVASEGGVFMGTALKKSPEFDQARLPDNIAADPRAFGHEDGANESSGITPFDGEWACPGWTMAEPVTTTNGPENFEPFEILDSGLGGLAGTDPITIGTDDFAYPIFAIGEPGRLRYDNWATAAQRGTWFTPNDCRNYAVGSNGTSSQPNFDSTAQSPVVARATTNPTCSVNASDCRVRYLQNAVPYSGQRFIRYAFYDIDQALVGNPSPSLPVTVDAEDKGNSTGQLRYVIGSLGAPRRAGNFEVWVYMGIAGGTETDLFRVARVPAGTSEVGVSLPDTTIATLPPLEVANAEPPRCKLVASDGERVYYAALETDPTAGMFTGIGQSASIDLVSDTPAVFFMSGGRGTEITALTQLDEQILIAKRGCLGTLTVVNGVASIRFISRAMGCVAPASVQSRDSRVYFLGERGLAMVSRWGNTNLGVPIYLCGNVQVLYNEGMDRRFDALVVGAIHEVRGQYMHTYRPLGDKRFTRRITSMFAGEHGGGDSTPNAVFDDDSHSFVVCDGIALSAIANVPATNGQPLLVGGTDEGFLVWLDRNDSQLHMMGETPRIWGTSSPSSTSALVSTLSVTCGASDTLDSSLEGMRGALLRYVDAAGNEQEVRILFVSGQVLYFDEQKDLGPAVTTGMTVGAQVHHWESGWLDFGSPQRLKNALWLDFVAKKQVQGQLLVEFFKDFDSDTEIAQTNTDLAVAQKEVSTQGLDGYWLKAAIRSVPLTTKAEASISQMVWRLALIDQD